MKVDFPSKKKKTTKKHLFTPCSFPGQYDYVVQLMTSVYYCLEQLKELF